MAGYRELLEIAKLQWGHVFSDVEMAVVLAAPADRPKLQWGHVFSDVEILADDFVSPVGAAMLQWGHVFSDVEIWLLISSICAKLLCFNGATSFQTWK